MAASQVLLAGRAFATSKIVRARSLSTAASYRPLVAQQAIPQNIRARRSRSNAGLKADSSIGGIDGGYSSVAVGPGDRRLADVCRSR